MKKLLNMITEIKLTKHWLIAIALITGIVAWQGKCFAWSISGTVYERDNTPLERVRIEVSGPLSSYTTTDSNGTYSIDLAEEGSYTITPSRGSCIFNPEKVTVSLYQDISQDFYRANRAPEIVAIPNQTTEEGKLLEFVIAARKVPELMPWGDPDWDRITYSCIPGLPERAYLDPERGEFKWVPDYTQAGTYNLTFIGTDTYGAESQPKTMTITVLNKTQGPLTIISKEPDDNSIIKTRGPAPCAFKFEVENLPEEFFSYATKPLTFWWDFQDGGIAHWPSPGHIYSEPGTYTVTLRLTDTNFNVLAQTTKTITVLPEPTPLRTFYVAPWGNDNYTKEQAQNPETPWQTLKKGVSVLQAGDRLYIRKGTYKIYGGQVEAALFVRGEGTDDAPIWISGYPGEYPYIDLTEPYRGIEIVGSYVIFENIDTNCPNYCLIGMRKEHITLRNNILSGSIWAGAAGAWGLIYNNFIKGADMQAVTIHYKSFYGVIKNNTITNAPHGIDPKGGTAYNQIFHNIFYSPSDIGVAIRLGGVQDILNKFNYFVAEAYDTIAHDNLIYNTNSQAIVFEGALRCSAIHNTIVVDPAYQQRVLRIIYVMMYAGRYGNDPLDFVNQDILILNNMIIGRENYDDNYLYVTPYLGAGFRSNNNLFWPLDESNVFAFNWMDQGTGAYSRYSTFSEYQQLSGQDLNSVTLDPKFVSMFDNDYHLTQESPAIDKGFSLPIDGFDLDRMPRPQGIGADIGAYEYVPGHVAYTISGRIVDKLGNGVEGVEVIIEGDTTLYTQTASDGSYQFSHCTAGSYLIRPHLVTALFAPEEFFIELDADIVRNFQVINKAPLLEPIGEKTVLETENLHFTVYASDPDDDLITYSVENLPPGATFTNQTFDWTPNIAQAGVYYVTFKATDTNNLIGEEKVKITVNDKDVISPTIVSVISGPNQVKIVFSEALEKTSAEDILNYAIDNNVTILATLLDTDNKTVILNTSTLSKDITYTLTVKNVTDLAGNPIASNTQQIFFLIEPAQVPGLMGYWKFDEAKGSISFDSSGNINHGVLNKGPVWTTGKVGTALYFDGIDDYVEVPDNDSLDLASAWTIAAWVNTKKAVLGGSNIQVIISKWSDSTTSSMNYLLEITSTGQARIRVSGAVISTTVLNDNQWYHLAGTFDKGELKIYVNAVEEANLAIGFANAYINKSPIRIGTYGFDLTHYKHHFNGKIDDVRIYNRALTTEEIQVLAGGISPPGPSLPGDIDGDGDVDIQDLLIVAKGYGVTYDLQDLLLVAQNYGRTQ